MHACAAKNNLSYRCDGCEKLACSVEVQRKKVKIECLGTNQNTNREKGQKNCERSYCGDHIAKNDPN